MPVASPIKPSINATDVLTLIVEEIVRRSPVFAHIDTSRIVICVASNKAGARGATYGKLAPLKFKGGHDTIKYRGRYFTMPKVMSGGSEILYLVYFYLPKFFDLDAKEKLKVIFHELYHISPEFNGDIRRITEGKAAHGSSRDKFNKLFETEQNEFYEYIKTTPYINFLDLSTKELHQHFKKVLCRRMKMPKPVAKPFFGKII